MAENRNEGQRVQRLAERKAYDRDTIDTYARSLTRGHIRAAEEAEKDVVPDPSQVYKETTWALESFYDKSLALEQLHDQVRTSSDPQQLQIFLDRLPATILRDMAVSAMAEEDRQSKKRMDIVRLLDYALNLHMQTTTAALHLLDRFKKMEDEEVEYVKKLLTDSRKTLLDKREMCEKNEVLDWEP